MTGASCFGCSAGAPRSAPVADVSHRDGVSGSMQLRRQTKQDGKMGKSRKSGREIQADLWAIKNPAPRGRASECPSMEPLDQHESQQHDQQKERRREVQVDSRSKLPQAGQMPFHKIPPNCCLKHPTTVWIRDPRREVPQGAPVFLTERHTSDFAGRQYSKLRAIFRTCQVVYFS